MLLVLFLAGLLAHGSNAITVGITCVTGPEYTVTVNADQTGGIFYISGLTGCSGLPPTTIGTDVTYIFNAANCGTVPALDTQFQLIVQDEAQLTLATDNVYTQTCNAVTGVQTISVGTVQSTLGAATLDIVNDLLPTFIPAIKNGDGTVITAGLVFGGPALIEITIGSEYTDQFGFYIEKLTVTASVPSTGATTDPLELVTQSCAVHDAYFARPNVANPNTDTISMSFDVFIPVFPNLDRPYDVPIEITFTADVKPFICPTGTCTAYPTCTTRKRRAVDNTTNEYEHVTLTRTITVYSDQNALNLATQKAEAADKSGVLCGSISGALIGVLAVLGLALLFSLLAVGFMFCRMRKRREEGYPNFPPGYENKSYKS